MTDSSIPDVPAFADALTPLERAKVGLQDELSVFEIGLLTYPGDDGRENLKKRIHLAGFLLKAIKAGRLAAYGDPDGWIVTKPRARYPWVFRKTPYPRCDGHQGGFNPYSTSYDECTDPCAVTRIPYRGDNCLITLADYLAFLALPEARGIPKPDGWKAPQGETAPLPKSEPDKSESGAAGTQNPTMNRQCVTDKARFLEVATWNGTQQATVNQHPEAVYFKGQYDMPTLLKWASEIDPRPKNQRGGRPRKS